MYIIRLLYLLYNINKRILYISNNMVLFILISQFYPYLVTLWAFPEGQRNSPGEFWTNPNVFAGLPTLESSLKIVFLALKDNFSNGRREQIMKRTSWSGGIRPCTYKKSSKWSLLTKWLCKGPSAEIYLSQSGHVAEEWEGCGHIWPTARKKYVATWVKMRRSLSCLFSIKCIFVYF
jgi:hypothetical protein